MVVLKRFLEDVIHSAVLIGSITAVTTCSFTALTGLSYLGLSNSTKQKCNIIDDMTRVAKVTAPATALMSSLIVPVTMYPSSACIYLGLYSIGIYGYFNIKKHNKS